MVSSGFQEKQELLESVRGRRHHSVTGAAAAAETGARPVAAVGRADNSGQENEKHKQHREKFLSRG